MIDHELVAETKEQLLEMIQQYRNQYPRQRVWHDDMGAAEGLRNLEGASATMRITPSNPMCMSCRRIPGIVLTYSANRKQKQWRCLPCAERVKKKPR
jgi:hypothetical protein